MDLPQALSWRSSTPPDFSEAAASSRFASANRRRTRLVKRHDNLRTGTRTLTQAEENQLFVKQMQIQMFMRSIGLSRPEAERFWIEHYASPPEESSVDDQCIERECETQLTVHYAQESVDDVDYCQAEDLVPIQPPAPVYVTVLEPVSIHVEQCLLEGTATVASVKRPATQRSAVHALSLLLRIYLVLRILTRLVPHQYVCRLPCGQSVCHGRAYSSALPVT